MKPETIAKSLRKAGINAGTVRLHSQAPVRVNESTSITIQPTHRDGTIDTAEAARLMEAVIATLPDGRHVGARVMQNGGWKIMLGRLGGILGNPLEGKGEHHE